jgi:hypothetical protein
MPSSSYNCVKKSDVDKLGKAAAQYKRMSSKGTVRSAASRAGGTLRNQMAGLVKGEPSLKQYSNVADAFHVWQDEKNVNVGLHPDHPMLGQAQKMHQSFQVSDVAFDLAQQAGEIEEEFLRRLTQQSKTWYQRFLGMRGAIGQ